MSPAVTSQEARARVVDAASELVATRLKQVSINELEDANQVFGSKVPHGGTPIVITSRRAGKANMLVLALGILLAFVGLFLSQIPYIKEYLADPIIWSGFGAVTSWPMMLVLLFVGIYLLITLTIPSGVIALMTRHGR